MAKNKELIYRVVIAALLVTNILTLGFSANMKSKAPNDQQNAIVEEIDPDAFVVNKTIKGFNFPVPKELDAAKKPYEELEKLAQEIKDPNEFEKKLKDFVVFEESESNYSIIQMGKFDLLAFTIEDIKDVKDFKTVREFTDKCYIGDISLTQRGEPTDETSSKMSKKIFPVAVGVVESIPQYTEEMFTVDKAGNYTLNEEAVTKAEKDGTLQYKPQYNETNTGYLSLISDAKTGKSYGVLVGYSVLDDSMKESVDYIARNLTIPAKE